MYFLHCILDVSYCVPLCAASHGDILPKCGCRYLVLRGTMFPVSCCASEIPCWERELALADVSPSVADGAGFRVELCFLPAAVLASSPADLASMSRLPCDPATNAICCLDSLPVLTTMSSREVDDIVSI